MDIKKVGMGLVGAFIALSVWHDPAGSAESVSQFLGDVMGFGQDVLGKAIEFFRGLTA